MLILQNFLSEIAAGDHAIWYIKYLITFADQSSNRKSWCIRSFEGFIKQDIFLIKTPDEFVKIPCIMHNQHIFS